MLKKLLATAVLLTVVVSPAFASMTIKEFRRFSTKEQSLYIGAAVSMLAYTYAAEGNPVKGRCIQDWYYGEPGKKTPGPSAITVELAVAEERDPASYTVEGVIMGLTDQVCGRVSKAPAQSR